MKNRTPTFYHLLMKYLGYWFGFYMVFTLLYTWSRMLGRTNFKRFENYDLINTIDIMLKIWFAVGLIAVVICNRKVDIKRVFTNLCKVIYRHWSKYILLYLFLIYLIPEMKMWFNDQYLYVEEAFLRSYAYYLLLPYETIAGFVFVVMPIICHVLARTRCDCESENESYLSKAKEFDSKVTFKGNHTLS